MQQHSPETAVRKDEIALQRAWSEIKSNVDFKFGLAVSPANGAAASQVVLVTLEPGKSGGQHAHSAGEILVVLEGTAELPVGAARRRISAGGIVLIPAAVVHCPINVGADLLRFLAIFPSAAFLHTWGGPHRTDRRAGIRHATSQNLMLHYETKSDYGTKSHFPSPGRRRIGCER